MYKYLLLCITLIVVGRLSAEEIKLPETPKISGVSFLSFQMKLDDRNAVIDNSFKIRRAYLTTSGKLTDKLSYKFTLDCFDADNGAAIRIKNLFATYKFGSISTILTDNFADFGVIPTPIMEFGQSIYHYRMYDRLSLERYEFTSSADLGFTLNGSFGGEVSRDYQNKVSSKFNGKYGTYQIGVYNGGGYSKINTEKNVAYQGRISLRPLGDMLPNLQVTGYGHIAPMYDTSKTKSIGDNCWSSEFALSYQEKRFNLLAEYLTGEGDPDMKLMNKTTKEIYKWKGYSLFGEFKFLDDWSIIARYDFIDKSVKYKDAEFTSIIGGIGYEIFKDNIILLVYDRQKN